MITMKKIAERVGVSRTTVSLVLNRKPDARISEETRQRVLEAAEKYGYKSEEQAETQNLICYLLCNRKIDDTSFYYYEQLKAFEQVASRRNFQLVFLTVDHSEEEYAKMIEVFEASGIKGAVVAGDYNMDIIKRIEAAKIPFVVLGVTNVEGFNCAMPDHFGAGCDATKHLIDLGHRRIAFFTGELYKLTHSLQLAGYRKAHEEKEIVLDPALIQISHIERGDDLVQRMKELAIDYTAIVTVNEHMGIEALNELKTKGRKIPGEFSLVAVGGGQASLQCRPQLTVMGNENESISTRALDILEKNIDNFNLKPEKAIVRNRLILRESTQILGR